MGILEDNKLMEAADRHKKLGEWQEALTLYEEAASESSG